MTSVLVIVVGVAPAQAATVTMKRGTLTVRADRGEAKAPTLRMKGRRLVLRLGAGDDRVRLDSDAGPLVIYGGDGDDSISTGDEADVIYGGEGRDQIRAGGGDDEVHGGPGYDIIWGEGGRDRIEGDEDGDDLFGHNDWGSARDDNAADTLIGGPGRDVLGGEGGPDVIVGGDGLDTVSYHLYSEPVTVTLDGRGPDGKAGEGDVVEGDVEAIEAGGGDDHLVGNSDDNSIAGNGGDDRIEGLAGADELLGDPGADTILGGEGPDELLGGHGDDQLDGGAGSDRFDARENDDRVLARDGEADASLLCGTGDGDVAVLDVDDQPEACERREYPDRVEEEPPPAPVTGSWSSPVRIGFPGSWPSGAVMTSDGDVVATWTEGRDDDIFGSPVRAAIAEPGRDPVVVDLDAGSDGSGATLNLDASGTVTAAWERPDGTLMSAERPPDGVFGEPEVMAYADPSASWRGWVTNRRGQSALVAYHWQERRWVAHFRLGDGSWGDEVAVSEPVTPLGAPWGWRVVLTEAGEIAVVWLHEPDARVTEAGEDDAWRIFAAVRTAAGVVLPVQTLSVEGKGYGEVQLAARRDGGAVAYFRDQHGAHLTERLPGAPFDPSLPLLPDLDSAALGVADNGRVTLAGAACDGGRVLAGPSIHALSTVRRFALTTCSGYAFLGQSPGGRAVAAFLPDTEHAVTATRDGDDPFSPVQDLRRDCGHVWSVAPVMNAAGDTAALATSGDGLWLIRQEPFEGAGLQSCVPGLYGEPAPPIESPPDGGAPPVPSPPAPEAGARAPRLQVTAVRIRRSRGRTLVTIHWRCTTRCRALANARLGGRRGRPVARVRKASRRRAGTQVLQLRLAPARTQRARAARTRPLVLRLSVVLRDSSGNAVSRRVTRRVR